MRQPVPCNRGDDLAFCIHTTNAIVDEFRDVPAAPIARKTSHAANNTMRTSIRKPNPNRDPKESYKRRTLIPLASQQNLERSCVVAHQADGCEEPPKLNDGPEHPVLPPNGSHGAFVFATVGEESCCTIECLPAD
jgi:hypothetical protein